MALDFAPGDHSVVCVKNGRSFYSPRIFTLAPLYNQVVPLRIADILNSENLLSVYGLDAVNLSTRHIIIVNNHPIRYISVVARVIFQDVKENKDGEGYTYLLYLCDTSGGVLRCDVPDYKLIQYGLRTRVDSNIGLLLRILGAVRQHVLSEKKMELHPFEIEILEKKHSRRLEKEIEAWKVVIDYRERVLSVPWVAQVVPHPEYFIDVENYNHMDNVIVVKKPRKQLLNGISSYRVDETDIDGQFVSDSIDINRRRLALEPVVDVLDDDSYPLDIVSNNSDATCEESYTNLARIGELEVIEIESSDRESVSTSDTEQSDCEPVPEPQTSRKGGTDSAFVLPLLLSPSHNIPQSTRAATTLSTGFHLYKRIDVFETLAEETADQKRIPNALGRGSVSSISSASNRSVASVDFYGETSSFSLNSDDVSSLIKVPTLTSFLLEDMDLTRLVIIDSSNVFNKVTLSLEFIRGLLKNENRDHSVELKEIYKNEELSNFLSLLLLKLHYIVKYRRSLIRKSITPSDFVQALDEGVDFSDDPTYRSYVELVQSGSVSKFCTGKEFAIYKGKLLQQVRQDLTNRGFITSFSNSSNLYLGYAHIQMMSKLILKRLKNYTTDRYAEIFSLLLPVLGKAAVADEALSQFKIASLKPLIRTKKKGRSFVTTNEIASRMDGVFSSTSFAELMIEGKKLKNGFSYLINGLISDAVHGPIKCFIEELVENKARLVLAYGTPREQERLHHIMKDELCLILKWECTLDNGGFKWDLVYPR